MLPENDETQEFADAKRLINAGVNNDDEETVVAGTQRLVRLAKKTKLDITNPVVAQISGLDKLKPGK